MKDIRQFGEKTQLLEKERDSLNSMTKQSDTFLQQLNQHLQKIRWKEQTSNADDISIKTLSENLATASHQCKLLEGSNLDDLKKQRQELESSNQSLITLVETTSSFDVELKSFTKKKEQINQKLKIIEELQNYAGSDLLSLDQQQKEQAAIINTLQAKLPDLQRIELIDDNLAILPLDKALTATDTKLSKVSSERAGTQIRIDEHERSQTALRNLQDQLISTGIKILESTPDKDHCPLCKTQFEEGQLMLRIASDTTGDSPSLSTELRSKLADLKTSEADLQQTKVLLMALTNYCGDAPKVTAALALKDIEEDKRKRLEYQESLNVITTKLTKYNESGLKVNRLKEIIELLDITEYAKNELDALLQSLRTESKNLAKKISGKKTGLDGANQQISVLAEKVGLPKSLPPAILSKTIATEIKHCDQKIAAAVHLAHFLDLEKDFSSIALSHQINEARDVASKLITTRKREGEANSRSQELEQQIKVCLTTLTEKQTILKRLSSAWDIISKLLSGQNSLESIKYELLKDNAAIISEIFSKIHLPNEYDINVKGEEIKLNHKVSGESRSLNEVSTGQRTAFALSLFLTMNKTLDSGPRVLLLDDPISHIDDVNMLSFLDYLRELAINGDRQIFFATPNTKLAGLFRHKFGFLGDNEFKEISLSR